MSASAPTESSRSGRSPPVARCTDVWRLEGRREIGRLPLAPFSSTSWTPITGVTETATVPRTRAFEPSLFVWAKVMSRPTEDHTIQFAALPTSSHRQRNNCEARRRSSAIATELRQAGTRPRKALCRRLSLRAGCFKRRQPGTACSRRHDLDDGAAVALKLAAPDTRYLSKCGERQGAAARHLAQRRIMKYDVRWKLLPACLGEAPGAQRLPDCLCGGVEVSRAHPRFRIGT